jgi:hypothetical protein
MSELVGKKVFVWVSYGDAKVYDISTKERYAMVLADVKEIVEQQGIDTKEAETIGDCIEDLGGIGSHETFEYGTGITLIK